MNKGQWLIVAFVGGALITAGAYIAIQWASMPPAEVKEATGVAASTVDGAQTPESPRLGEQAAQTIAVQTLMGDPYGRSSAEVVRNLTPKGLSRETGQPEWVWQVRVAPTPDLPQGVDGQIRINADNGRLTTDNLPYLD